MTAKDNGKLRLAYGVFLGVFTVVLGILLIVKCSLIYYADPSGAPFTRETVGKNLMDLLVPAIIWVIAVIVGYVLSVLFPYADKRKRVQNARRSERLLKKRIPAFEEDNAELKRYKNYGLVRIIIWSVCAAFALAAGIITIIYLSDAAHFPTDEATPDIVAMLRAVLPWIAASFALFIGATLYEGFTAGRDLRALKKLLASGKGRPIPPANVLGLKEKAAAAARSPITVWAVRGAVIALGIAFVIAGALNGGAADVMQKAINLCTQCIGLG